MLCLLAQPKKNNKFKNKNNQNCQKIELYGSPTTKEFKKKHSSRQVAGAEMGSQGRVERTRSKAVAGGPAVPHSHIDKPGGTTGVRDRPHNPGFWLGEIKPQTSN